jgi:ABC-type multidrug transport system fused ATPase/permease subunit
MGFHGHHMRAAAADKGDFDWKLLTRAFRFVAPYKLTVALSLFSVLVVTASDLSMPYLLRTAIDQDIAGGNMAGLLRTATLYLCAILINNLLTSGQTYVTGWLGQRVIFDLRDQVFTHLQSLSLSFYDGREMGDTISRMTEDIDILNELVSNSLITLVNTLFSLGGVVLVMVAMNLRLSLLNFAVIPLMLLVTAVLRRWMGTAYRKTRQKIADVTHQVEEGVSGVRIIQSFGQEDRSSGGFRSVNEENRAANMEAASVRSLYFPLVEVIGSLGVGLVLWFGGAAILRGDLTVGVLVAFVLYLFRFFEPIRSLTMLYDSVLAAMAAAERIFELLDTKPSIMDPPQPVHLGRIEGLIEYRNVGFAYVSDQPVLQDLNIVARPGETIALVGATGAGKSTIISLLSRLYDVQEGAILIDGHDLRDIAIQSLRQQLGIVLQEGFLFSDAIRDNIRYGKLEATDEEVEAAAKTVGAHEFIMRLPEGYDTEVRERGEKLSIGERQLICLARALTADPRILILDEATSSVDPYTELIIQDALMELFRGRTSIVIAHRLSTIRRADRIYVMDHGRVAEVGSHQELLARGGLYANLYEMQFKVQEVAAVEEEDLEWAAAGTMAVAAG